MAFLTGLRDVFTRRRPVVDIDVSSTQAQALADAPSANATELDRPVVPHHRPPVRPEDPARPPARGTDELLGLVRRIGDHLDDQAQHTRKLDSLIERLPDALDTLPEINRQNARLLDVLGDHLERTRCREDAMQSTLGRMSEASNHQTEVLGLVREQLDTGNRAAGQMVETLGTVRQTLLNLSDSTATSVRMLSEMVQMGERRTTELTTLFSRTQRWMLVALVCCGVVSVAAVTVAIALFLA